VSAYQGSLRFGVTCRLPDRLALNQHRLSFVIRRPLTWAAQALFQSTPARASGLFQLCEQIPNVARRGLWRRYCVVAPPAIRATRNPPERYEIPGGAPRRNAMLKPVLRKLLRPLELVLLAVIGAVEWVIDWVERQSTAMKLGLGMLLGVAATMAVAAIYAWLR